MKQRLASWRHEIGFQALALAGSTGTAQVVVAVLYIVTARSSAPDQFGLVVAAIAVGTTAVGLLDFGTNSYWTRELAARRLNAEVLGKRLTSKLLYAAVVLFAWSLSTALWVQSMSLWIAGPIAMSVLLSQTLQVPLRSLGRGDIVAVAVLLEKLVAAATFMVLMSVGAPPVTALWLALSIGGLSSALFCWKLTPIAARPVLRLSRSTNPWTSSRHYGIATAALTAQSLDIPTLTMFGGANAAGVYAAVSKWTQPMSLLASAFSSASAPHIAKADSGRAAWRSAKKSIWLLWAAIGLCIIIAIFAPPIVEILVGPKYAPASGVLRVLAIATVFAVINQPLYVFLQSRGFDRPIALITLSSVLLQLALVALLSGNLHERGAAVAALCTQLILLIAMSLLLAAKWRDLRHEVVDISV